MMVRLLVAVVLGSALAFPASAQGPLRHSHLPLHIRNVHYRTKNVLPAADRQETTRRLRQAVNDPDGRKIANSDDLRDTVTYYARALLEDHGFWNSRIKTSVVKLPAARTVQPFDVIFDINEGQKVYLSAIVWTGVKVFTDEELQKIMPIHAGEVASRRQIGDGLQSARKLYASRGYVNFTIVPENKIDDSAHTMSIVFNVNEGAQFRFGELILPGLDDAHAQTVLQRWQAILGTLYSPQQEEAFFRSVMWPAYRHNDSDYRLFSQLLHRQLNERERTVNFSISFVAQPRDVD